MPIETRGVDHVIMTVKDMDTAVENCRKLGFNVTPRMHHPFGTGNNLIMFQTNFLEILGVTDPANISGVGALIKSLLDRREGVSHFAFASTDAQADYKELLRKGLKPNDVSYFERAVDLPDGSHATAKVSVCTFEQSDTPLVMLFASQQHIAEAVWIPEWQVHPNGAIDISCVTIVSLNPARDFQHRFEALFGAERVCLVGRELTARTPNGVIEAMAPEALAARLPGATIRLEDEFPYVVATTVRVADLRKLERIANKSGVPLEKLGNGGLLASREAANGVYLEFVE